MKRLLALILCAVMLLLSVAGCTTLEKDEETGEYDKGAIIPMYLGTEMYSFDPTVAYLNDSNVKILSLLYESLTDIDENGKLKMSLIKDYEINDGDRYGEYKMTITLKDTKWSDGRSVQAADVVYAWKRILDVDYDCEAACMLYDIKNARAIKSGEMTIDDIGLTAPETLKLEIEFEHSIDYQQFLRNLSSPALVPLREDIVSKSADWAKKPATMVTSGPFMVKSVEYNHILRLERSNYYFLNTDKDEVYDKYVIPFRIENDYGRTLNSMLSSVGQTDPAINTVFYDSELPLDQRAAYKDYVTTTDLLSTHTYYFNLNNPLLADARVRKALSLAIDRQKIADEIVVFAKPATGFVPYKATNGKVGTSFREEGGDVISATADVAAAKQLLSEAGVSGGSLRISYYADDAVSAAIANYVQGVWAELGFNVTLQTVRAQININDPVIYSDTFHNFYTVDQAKENRWDILAIDYQMLCEEPFSALAPFATDFSGNGVDLSGDVEGDEEYPVVGHMTGYKSDAYDAIIEEAYAATDIAERTEKLHEAEKMLMDDMPVMPIIFNQNAYVTYSNVVSGFKTDYYGVTDFKDVKMENYMAWKKVFDTVAETQAAPAA